MKYKVIIVTTLLLAISCMWGCKSSPADQSDSAGGGKGVPTVNTGVSGVPAKADLVGRAWVRIFKDGNFDGFYLSPDRTLLMINVYKEYGLKWMINGKMMVLAMQVYGEEQPETVLYKLTMKRGKLYLTYEGAKKPIEYSQALLRNPFDNTQWEVEYIIGGTARKASDQKIFVQFDGATGQVNGYGGVNKFRGTFKRIGAVGVEFGQFARTRMAGPGLDYENEFMDSIVRSNAVLAIGNHMWLYDHGQLSAILTASETPQTNGG